MSFLSTTVRRSLAAMLALQIFVAAHSVNAQTTISPRQHAADSLLAAAKWEAASAAYAAIVTSEPTNGAAWTNYGESLIRQRKPAEAAAAFARAEQLTFRPFVNMVNQARAYVANNDQSRAFEQLARVIDGGAGGALKAYILGAAELAPLASSAQWKQLVAGMRPCMTAPYRQFDFWIGDWDVHGVFGNVVGHNEVTLEQDGCLLVEHWTSLRGGQSGSSFNYYDVRDKKWHQLYIDNSGNAGSFPALTGEFVDGKMVMLTEDTNSVLSRWTWYLMESGKVKQLAEVSRDHGKSWQTSWNSVYVEKKNGSRSP